MLGIKTRRYPISGDIADNIRSAIVRVSTGQLNEKEKLQAENSKLLRKQYEAHIVG